MAKDKKTVVVYTDWIEKFEELTDEEAGRLIKHFFRYVNDLEPEAPDRTTKLMFIDIKNTLKRDLNKYAGKVEKRSEAGILGNLKRYQIDLYNEVISEKITLEEAQRLAKARKGVQEVAKLADSDSDSDSGSDSGSEIIDKSITITKKENYNIHLNFKNLSLNDQAYIESVAMNKRTNVKTVITYLDNFNAHLISERQIKADIIDYQRLYKRWLNLQQIQTIKEKAVNPYKNNLVGVKPLKK